MADALDDDFQIDTASSPAAEASNVSPPASDAEESAPPSKKRKLDKTDDSKPKKVKRSKKQALAEEKPTIGFAPTDIQCDHMHAAQDAALTKASSLEKDELRFSESWFLDVSTHGEDDRKLLADFMNKALPSLAKQVGKASKKNGSPRVIIVSLAALRVVDLVRDMKTLTAKGEVAKLFSKHFKLAEHETYCSSTAFSVAIGTPDRIGKLITSSTLSLDSTTYLILDVSYLDKKLKSLLTQKEAAESLFKSVLGAEKVRTRMKEGKMKLVLF